MSDLTVIEDEEPALAETLLYWASTGGRALKRQGGRLLRAQQWLVKKGWFEPDPEHSLYMRVTPAGREENARRIALLQETALRGEP